MYDKSFFQKNGYCVIKNLLRKDEVDYYRKILSEIDDISKTWDIPDGITKNKNLWSLITNKKLISNLNNILGEIKYTQHSDILINTNGVGWHRDNAHRKFNVGSDWDEKKEKYSIVRVAIYLHKNQKFKLGVIPNSNKNDNFINQRKIAINNMILNFKQKKGLRANLWKPKNAKMDFINLNFGDCIFFDQRLYHSPIDISGEKIGLFLSYGVQNFHTINHINYYRSSRKDLGYLQKFPEELENILKKKDLLFDENI